MKPRWKTKEPSEITISGEVIFRMKKPRARTEKVFTEDPEDPWFINAYEVERKTQKAKERWIYIAKDLQHVIQFYISSGWVLEVVNQPKEAQVSF